MEVRRSLLVQGNEKLSAGVFHFDLPPVQTCPGKSGMCEKACYARTGRFCFPKVTERLAWAYTQSKRSDFVDRMVDELYRNGILLMRWHCAGDIYSPAYANKMLEIMQRSSHCTFWLYTRSWRIPAIMPVIEAMAALSNCTVWLSSDAETGIPVNPSTDCKVAWMQTSEAENTEEADLVFRVRKLRKIEPAIANVCPTETPKGKAKGITCATCQLCWRGA